MRLLADENFPGPLVEQLRQTGHDVSWARTEYPGWTDSSLLEVAESEARIILTLDNDFWQIALQRRPPLERAGIVVLRIHPATPTNLGPLVDAFASSDKTWAGHVSIIRANEIQMIATQRSAD